MSRMVNEISFIFPAMLLVLNTVLFGQNFLFNTKHRKYLASKEPPVHGNSYGDDYNGGTCNLKQRGAQKQHNVRGCRGIEMKCDGGCLTITSASYYCKENAEDNPQHKHQAMNICEDTDECTISASREIFGQSTCAGTPDSDMSLYIVYRYDGGSDSTRLTGQHKCSSTPAGTGKCEGQEEGALVEKDVPGCGGRMELKCEGGCLRIHNVLYQCNKRNGNPNVEQLKKVQARCEKKKSCAVSASRRMFLNTECVDSPDAYMKIIYRCDGGKERSRLTGRKTCRTTAVTTENPQTPSPPTCHTQHGEMFNNDIPLERAEITLYCSPRGGDRRQRTKRQVGGQMSNQIMSKPCIFIHNVRAACKLG